MIVSISMTALHAGENVYKYHGHYDLGTFYLESNGARFFTDLENENYELENRLYSYRIRAEGHNTLVINPSQELDQQEGAECLITQFGRKRSVCRNRSDCRIRAKRCRKCCAWSENDQGQGVRDHSG